MSDPVTYTGVLPIGEHNPVHPARLLDAERCQRRTRRPRRALKAIGPTVIKGKTVDLFKKPGTPNTPGAPSARSRPAELSVDRRTINMLYSATRALAERGNSLLKTTSKALRRVSLCPWRICAITAAALVLLHTEHAPTT